MRVPRIAGLLFFLGIAALLYTFNAQRKARLQAFKPAAKPFPDGLALTSPELLSSEKMLDMRREAKSSTPTRQKKNPEKERPTRPRTAPATRQASSMYSLPAKGRGAKPTSTSKKCMPSDVVKRPSPSPRRLALCNTSVACELSRRAPDGGLLLLRAGGATDPTLTVRLAAARDAATGRTLLVVDEEAVGAAAAISIAQSLGVGWWRMQRQSHGSLRLTPNALDAEGAVQWSAALMLSQEGCAVVIVSAEVVVLRDPVEHLSGDCDAEVVQQGSRLRQGSVVGLTDAEMGWSAYSQTMTIPALDDAVVALQPTTAGVFLAEQMMTLLSGGAPEAQDPSSLLTALLYQPAHDEHSRAGISSRVLSQACYAAGAADIATAVATRFPTETTASQAVRLALGPTAAKAMPAALAAIRAGQGRLAPPLRHRPLPPGFGAGVNDLLLSVNMSEARQLVLRRGCGVVQSENRPARVMPRPLNWLLAPGRGVFPIPTACDADDNLRALCATLRRTAINREVLAAVSNKNIHPMLRTFIEGTRLANISNAVVVALDDETQAFSRALGAATYTRKLISRTKSTDNHATSGLKFAIIKEFISVGCSVLMSDVDIVWIQNPFTLPSLYRDVDVEGMTDGWDDVSALGYMWRTPDGDHLRMAARNSGLFFVQASSK